MTEASGIPQAVREVLRGSEVLARVRAASPLRVIASSRFPKELSWLQCDGESEHCILILSAREDPQAAVESAAGAQQAACAVGPELAWAVLEPLAAGVYEGRSYAIFPRCHELSHRFPIATLQTLRLRSALVDWLIGAARATARPFTAQECRDEVQVDLLHLSSREGMDDEVKRHADRALRALASKEWSPTAALMHNDYWRGNVMLADPGDAGTRSWRRRLRVIDWRGAVRAGYPVYDLVRILESTRSSRALQSSALQRMSAVLGGPLADSRHYLLAALGRLGRDLGRFPESSYHHLCRNTIALLARLLPDRP